MFRYGQQAAARPVPAAPAGMPRKVPQWLFLPHLFNDIVLADRAAMGAGGASTRRVCSARDLSRGAVSAWLSGF